MQSSRITVRLPYITEEIYIGKKMLDFVISKIGSEKYDKHILIVDINTKKDRQEYFKRFSKELNIADTIALRPTPNYKSFKECEKIIKKLIRVKASRRSCLISVGGGYVSDITGYVASNYMRGIDFIQISTTLMSMADAVIGKVAINFQENKNLLGSFYSPRYVFSDLDFLSTLNKKEVILGLSEVWKHALIRRNNKINSNIDNFLSGLNGRYYQEFIEFSMKVKRDCVVPDYNDKNGRHKLLSLGHTFANCLEKESSVRHGAAVIYGIIFASILSNKLGRLSNDNFSQITQIATKFEKDIGLLEKIQKSLKIERMLDSFYSDKISDNGTLNFVLPVNHGCFVEKNITRNAVVLALKSFKKLAL